MRRGTMGSYMSPKSLDPGRIGRTVTVANANTFIDPGLFQGGRFSPDVAVCAVELATMVPGTIVQPYRVQQMMRWGAAELGNPVFDDRIRINTADAGFVRQILHLQPAQEAAGRLFHQHAFIRHRRLPHVGGSIALGAAP